MAIDGEPEDGDYVRYIDSLNRQAGSPGQVLQKPARASNRGGWGGWGRRGATTSHGTPSAPAPAAALPGVAPGDAGRPPPTLAARTGQRRVALALTIAGAFALWHAVRLLMLALEYDPMEFDDLVPAVFLGICAFMLLKGGSRLRSAQRRRPLPALPPLSTLPPRDQGRA